MVTIYNNYGDNDDNKSTRKIQWRGGFSDRNGYGKLPTTMQLKKFNERTKISICNLFNNIINDNYPGGFNERARNQFYRDIIEEVYCESTAEFKYYDSVNQVKNFQEYIEKPIMNGSFSEILTLVEYVIFCCEEYLSHNIFGLVENLTEYVVGAFNELFQREYVGYRLIDGKAIPITDEIEQKAIEQSLDTRFAGCKSQLQKALGFLSDREHPDYKNSIKESISAVESICQIITNDNHATLGEALKLLENEGITLHPALKKAFSSIYGYTSDKGGIRHAEGMFESNVTFEEAKYMLISCCAFVNFLTAEMGKIKNA